MSGDSTSPNIMYLRTHAAYLWILSLEQTSALSAGSHSHASLGALFWSVACLVVAFSCCWTELGTWLLHDSWLLWWLGHKSLRLGLEAPVLCLPVSSACAKKNLQHLSPMILDISSFRCAQTSHHVQPWTFKILPVLASIIVTVRQ